MNQLHQNYSQYSEQPAAPWLPKIPSHWDITPNRGLFAERNVVDHPDETMLSVTIEHGVIPQSVLLDSSSNKDLSRSDRSRYKLVEPHDIVYNKMRAWQGAIGVSPHRGIVSPAYVVEKPQPGVNPQYVHRLFRLPAFQAEAQRWSYGIASDMWSLRPEHFKAIHTCVPPPKEQATIVRYLDDADELINRYISAKEQLIALLEEQRQAVIQQAVTRGLDTSTAFEPFSVPELGDVPDNWEIVQLGRLGDFSKGSGGTKDDEVTEGLPCVRYGDIYTSHKYFVRQTRSFIARHRAHDYAPMKYGDVLFTGSGETIEDIGKSVVNLIDGEAYCGGDVILFRPRDKTHPKFLGYLLDSARAIHQKSSMGRGITIMHVYSSQLKYLWLALPPFADQVQIAAYLGKITNEVDQAIHGTQRQINLMNEYRTRLIADVVTGQIDVRDATVELPDQHL